MVLAKSRVLGSCKQQSISISLIPADFQMIVNYLNEFIIYYNNSIHNRIVHIITQYCLVILSTMLLFILFFYLYCSNTYKFCFVISSSDIFIFSRNSVFTFFLVDFLVDALLLGGASFFFLILNAWFTKSGIYCCYFFMSKLIL